ncbi:XRE family transcriptional regulator [Burkholderia cenocepacia]|uniref:XRE family transcriptional regulator n=1 Tax=Burkholderia cenocepacia TaxID=95486 RepID=UPI001AA1D0AA|nr:XRE family transcriptional regulator [Burkholderia cenocepacia]MBO1859321.1 XRE family transcriptional regulator [Burkholderia cenocepacia]
MTEKLTTYDPVEDLTTDDAVADFIALAEETGDPAYIAHAREVAARAMIAGSGNVYADLGDADAAAMQNKARRVARIASAIEARQWSHEQAADALGLPSAELTELLAGRFRAYSVDGLERLASRIEK